VIQIIVAQIFLKTKQLCLVVFPGLWEEVGGAESLGMRLKVELLHGNRDGINQ